MQLRDYQSDLIEALRKAFHNGYRRPICVAGCGVGKTVLATFMCEHHNGYTWFLVHRRELIEQTKETFGEVPDNVMIGMVQTVTRHLDDYRAPTMIIFDECHHATAKQWTNIINKYPNVPIIGLTATPCRLDGKPLGSIFDTMVFAPNNNWMIDNGYLSPFKYYAPDINLEDANWKIKGSDYDQSSVAETLDKPAIYGNVMKYIDLNKKTIIYAPNIDYSMKLSQSINNSFKRDVCAHFDGNTPDKLRDDIIKRFRNGDLRILINVDLIGEGFDVPDCDCCILLRPTTSVSLYIQQSMRCMRYKEGKTAVIYDLVGNVFKHGLITDNREWSLNKPVKIRNKTEEKDVVVRECKFCFRVYAGTSRICPYCNKDNGMTRKQLQEQHDRELQEVKELKKKEERREQGMAATEAELIALAKRRGYKNPVYWARHIMMSRRKKL